MFAKCLKKQPALALGGEVMTCLGSTERTLAPLWKFLPGAVRGLQGNHFQTWQPFCRAVPMGRGNHALSPVWEAYDQGGACSGLCGPTAGKWWHEMMEQSFGCMADAEEYIRVSCHYCTVLWSLGIDLGASCAPSRSPARPPRKPALCKVKRLGLTGQLEPPHEPGNQGAQC